MNLRKNISIFVLLLTLGTLTVGCNNRTTVNLYGEGNLHTILKNDNLFEANDINTNVWLENIDPDDGVTTVWVKPTITAVGENVDYELYAYLEVIFNDTKLGNIKVEKMIGNDKKGVIPDGQSKTPILIGSIPMELTEEQMLDVGRIVYKLDLDDEETYCSIVDMDFVKYEEERDKDSIEANKKIIEELNSK